LHPEKSHEINQLKPFLMKKSNFTLITMVFVFGIVIGSVAITFLSSSNPGPVPAPAPVYSMITADSANKLFKLYYNNISALNDKVKGFSLDKDQVSTLYKMSTDPTLKIIGFRIYFGLDKDNQRLTMIAGMQSDSSDLAPAGSLKSVYVTNSRQSSPCPPSCDKYSPITK
jgi:hypothetical protein